MTLPAGMPTTMVQGTYIYTDPDNTDAGVEPQGTPLEGLHITFNPEPDSRIYTHTATGLGVAMAPMLATTDALGRIITPATGATGFKLPASAQPALTGSPVIPWTAEIVDPMGRIETDRRTFLAPTDGTVTLPSAPRYWPDPQAGSVAQWEQARALAQALRDELPALVEAELDKVTEDGTKFALGDMHIIASPEEPPVTTINGRRVLWLKDPTAEPPEMFTYKAIVLKSNPKGLWMLNQSTPIPNEGTGGVAALTGSATTGAGPVGALTSSADFNGAQILSSPATTMLQGATAAAVEYVIRPEVMGGGIRNLFKIGANFEFLIYGGRPTAKFGAATYVQSVATFTPNEDVHVVINYTGTKVQFWIGGVARDEFPVTGPIGAVYSQQAMVGNWSATGTNQFDGRAAVVGVWDRALTPAEILEHATAAGLA